MPDDAWLADRFETHRAHLRAVARRMLGSASDADDAVQEAWLRLSRADTSEVDNLGGWLTTVVARISLDMLRSRASRREDHSDAELPDGVDMSIGDGPEHQAELADSVGAALVVVLDTLSPSERLAFVLHDLFAVPFDDVGAILHRSPNAAKQLASRARHKVHGTGPSADTDPARQRLVVDAFLAASRGGDFEALISLLAPDVVLRADAAAVRMGSPEELRGPAAVAGMFSGRALGAQPAMVDGGVGMVWIVGDRAKVVWDVVIDQGKIVAIDMIAAPDTLGDLDLTVLDG